MRPLSLPNLLPSQANLVRRAAIVAAGVALMTLSAKVQIPFWPVPMTLHTLAVFAFAVLLGPQLAVGIFLGYLAVGALGWPVFSGTPARGIGLGYMVGPTGGYLLGYLVASAVTGTLAARRGIVGQCAAMLLGLAIVYALGMAWLGFFVPGDKLLALGVVPFLTGDLVKIGLVAAGAAALRRVRESRS
ncbi:MAG TPA: biotin transporter BioY [Microvirga sp.]|jgi:biotin transport system substrate-specific component